MDVIARGLAVQASAALRSRLASPVTALSALAVAARRPIDIVMFGDSTQIFGGYGWDAALTKAYATRFGIWASPLYPQVVSGTQYSNQGYQMVGTTTTVGALSGADPFFNDRQLPDAPYHYLATGDILNGGIFISADSVINPSARLRYHVYHGTFASGAGSFRLAVRLEASPNTALATGGTISTNTGAVSEAEATLDVPAGDRTGIPIGMKLRLPGGGAQSPTVGPTLFLGQRVQNLDRESGVSLHSFYGIGGQSAYDMAQFVSGKGFALVFTAALAAATGGTLTTAWATGTGNYTITFSDGSTRSVTLTSGSTAVTWTGAITASANASAILATNQPSLARLMWAFGKLRNMQIARGHRPIIVVRLCTGLNDRNEAVVPSLGWRQSVVGNSAAAYRDNLEAFVTRLEDGWRAMGWPISELFFLLVPSYPVTAVDDMGAYRAQAAAMAASRPNTSWIDMAALVPGSETLAAGGLVDGTHFTDAWADEMARREVAQVPALALA